MTKEDKYLSRLCKTLLLDVLIGVSTVGNRVTSVVKSV